MVEKLADEKRKPGRPRKAPPVQITLSYPSVFTDYLSLLGERFGWGSGHTEVARFLLTREVARLQEAAFHEKEMH